VLCGLTHFSRPPLERKLTSSSALIAVHGTWDEWSPWSLCSSTCGRGYRDRTRTCKPPQFGGNPCEGPEKQTKFCNIALCPGKAVRDSKPSLQQVSPSPKKPVRGSSSGSVAALAESAHSRSVLKRILYKEREHWRSNLEVLAGIIQVNVVLDLLSVITSRGHIVWNGFGLAQLSLPFPRTS